MSIFAQKGVTNLGRALIAKAQTGVPIEFTRFKVGDGNLSGRPIATLTDLVSPKQTYLINRKRMIPPNTARLGFVLENSNIDQGFYFREVGIYAKDPDEGEILYMYANAAETADYIPPKQTDIVSKDFNFKIAVGSGTTVVVNIDESLTYPSFADLNDTLKDYLRAAGGDVAGQVNFNNNVTFSRWGSAGSGSGTGQYLIGHNCYINPDTGKLHYLNTHADMGAKGIIFTYAFTSSPEGVHIFDTGRIATTKDAEFTPAFMRVETTAGSQARADKALADALIGSLSAKEGSSQDADDYTEIGAWVIRDASAYVNLPSGMSYSILEVIRSKELTVQRLTGVLNRRLYIRTRDASDTWTNWVRFDSADGVDKKVNDGVNYAIAVSMSHRGQLTILDDLDGVTQYGSYNIPAGLNITKLPGPASDFDNGGLLVYNDAGRITQMALSTSTGRIVIRTRLVGSASYSDWIDIVNTKKLTTSLMSLKNELRSYTDAKVSEITIASLGGVSSATFSNHVGNMDMHVTPTEKETWFAKETPDGAQIKATKARDDAINASVPRTGGTMSGPLKFEKSGSTDYVEAGYIGFNGGYEIKSNGNYNFKLDGILSSFGMAVLTTDGSTVRNPAVRISTAPPTYGSEGDIWIQY